MKKLFSLALACAASLCMAATPAFASALISPVGYVPDMKLISIANMNATDYTNATTSYTDIAEATVTVPAMTYGDYTKRYVRTCFSAAVSKATSTNGSLRVNVNGTGQAASVLPYAFAAGAGHISECFTMQRPTASAFIVKIQGVSGDTAVFTVSDLQMEVWEIRLN